MNNDIAHAILPESPMQERSPERRRLITALGLVLAVFGTPAFLWALKIDVGDPTSLGSFVGRELGVFALLGVLLVLVRKGERLPLSSIGWSLARPGRSVLWGLVGLVPCIVVLGACIALAQVMHWKVGAQEPDRFIPPLWATGLMVLRAGVTEEAFYRGYALERLRTLTGSRLLATALTVVPFALFHVRQGPAGIVIAGAIALVFTAMYWKRRDLLAVMVTHFLVDFIPNVALPLLGVG